ncbi:uncharacterized protein [Misgurnus anguillicaudatus]|uniref:uncharacterized protein n=1 Tax=Misgurnus anguillicaudatus TaxID=75329 RepID=UPI003CCF4288
MKHLFLMCLLFYMNIHTTQSKIFNRSVTVGKDVILGCKHEGKVVWSKDRNGTRVDILTAEKDEVTIKRFSIPLNRYGVLDDLSLHIKSVSVSDSGIYYCNATPTVNLIVTEPDPNNSEPEGTTPTQNPSATNTLRSLDQTTGFSHSQPESTTPTQDSSATNTLRSLDQTTGFSHSQPESTTPTQDSSATNTLRSLDQTTGFSHSQPEGTTPSQDPSAKKSFRYFCMKEIK